MLLKPALMNKVSISHCTSLQEKKIVIFHLGNIYCVKLSYYTESKISLHLETTSTTTTTTAGVT